MPGTRALSSDLRKQLETAVLAARRAAEGASRATIEGLGVFLRDKPGHLDADQAALRNGLRAKWRQLGENQELLVAECAYEQWHRLLFARFLAENNLLLHPQYKAPVTLADCDELAAELGEPDGWSVAARFAAEILPGIFPVDDPCFRLRLAPEGRHALEEILDGVPEDVFVADDALGWVYQFWQKDKKDEVNNSERKIGGADLGPVTQLFTENYMVRFLLENTLGAWWAARHPQSRLVEGFEYLRFDDDSQPAAGSFSEWPDRVAEVTVMDPCCGSGHFLVEAFSMLWQMRVEEDGLSPIDAQDAVLRDNLFGLELDSRCVQIAMFAVALQAWKAGGGWRALPTPNIACSGLPVKAPVEEWKALAQGDQRLEAALVRLHLLFRDADTLGSLIDPRRTSESPDPTTRNRSLEDVDWNEICPLLETATRNEDADPAVAVLGLDAAGLGRAAEYLSQDYTLVITNVPYLGRWRMGDVLKQGTERVGCTGREDLVFAFARRWITQVGTNGGLGFLARSEWTFLRPYESFRRELLERRSLRMLIFLGGGAFSTPLQVKPAMTILSAEPAGIRASTALAQLEASSPLDYQQQLPSVPLHKVQQIEQLENPDARVLVAVAGTAPRLGAVAFTATGLSAGDSPRFDRFFWEPGSGRLAPTWEYLQGTPSRTMPYGGRERLVLWEQERGAMARLAESVKHLNHAAQSWRRGKPLWGQVGVAVSPMGSLPCTLYTGDRYDLNTLALVPRDQRDLPALWSFCSSDAFEESVRRIDSAMKIAPRTLEQVPFDVEHWREVAEKAGPLPEPSSDSPTQWLFNGRPEASTAPLQVTVARLVGYRWPEQAVTDDLEACSDADGIVCLPSVAGELPAAERMQQMLATAFGEGWSPMRVKELLEQAGSRKRDLAQWLSDEFFKQHCALFRNRPFVWHIWDGQRDGFSALVHYHRLDRKLLEKLTYTYLGQDWVERQRAAARDEVAGAEARLSAALDLQHKLEAILEGEEPYDIYVRWKELHEQPIGWEPDLDDGVRFNIRPFAEAGVLKPFSPWPFKSATWKKDRGKNPDGSERHNDIHLSLAEKRDARTQAGRT
jgi:hypothetical protein